MSKNIKSLIILKKIFSYVYDNILLELIKYNKNIQKVLNIDIVNYKIFSGKSIVMESDGKGKIYNNYNNRLVFEGEYKNGKRNGTGKEYSYDGKLLFEGEYLNNKRNGNGKEYFSNGNIKFEGKYLNGKKWTGIGYDIGYDKNNKKMFEIENGKGHIKGYIDRSDYSIFEGEYLNGEKNGKGKEYFDNKLLFEGEYLNGKRNGKGIEYNTEHKCKEFEGQYYNGKEWNGKGYNPNNGIIYELKNGKGIKKKYIWETGDPGDDWYVEKDILIFEGEYLNGEKNGKGKEYDFDGKLKFEGEYVNNRKNGKGKEYNSQGNLIFEGEYLYDHKRFGKEFENAHLIYEGEYLYDKKWNGKVYDIKGNIYELSNGYGKIKEYSEKNSELLIFDGEFINGIKKGIYKEYSFKYNGEYYLEFEGEYYNEERNGKGKQYYTYSDKLKFEGEYKNGFQNGKGREYNEKGEIIFEGEFKSNKWWNGKGKEYNLKGDVIFEGEYLAGKRWNGKGIKVEYFDYTNKGGKKGTKKYNVKYENGLIIKNKPCLIF